MCASVCLPHTSPPHNTHSKAFTLPSHIYTPFTPPTHTYNQPPPTPPPKQVLKKICWYAVLAPSYSTSEGSSSDVSTLVATTAAYKQLGDLPLHQQLLGTFTNPEIVRWGLFEAQYGAEIAAEVGVGGVGCWVLGGGCVSRGSGVRLYACGQRHIVGANSHATHSRHPMPPLWPASHKTPCCCYYRHVVYHSTSSSPFINPRSLPTTPHTHPTHLFDTTQTDVFAGEYGPKHLADLKLRVIEHNVLVVSKYYTRISTTRLAELLDLTPLEVRGCLL